MISPNHSNNNFLFHELQLGKELAIKAGEIMLQYFESDQQELVKEDGTPVTIADTIINTMVIKEISKHFPKDIIVGEEESTGSYGMGRQWICDPIDGTKAFTIGLPTSMFSLCFINDGVPMTAVAYEPHSKQLFTAVRGHGSYCNNQKLKVSKNSMDKAKIALAPDYIKTRFIDEPFMKKLLNYNKQLTIFDGAVFRGCLVASGRIDGFPHPSTTPHDIAAIHLIIEEAGGKVTDLHGKPLDYSIEFRSAIISNGIIHKDLVALFRN